MITQPQLDNTLQIKIPLPNKSKWRIRVELEPLLKEYSYFFTSTNSYFIIRRYRAQSKLLFALTMIFPIPMYQENFELKNICGICFLINIL